MVPRKQGLQTGTSFWQYNCAFNFPLFFSPNGIDFSVFSGMVMCLCLICSQVVRFKLLKPPKAGIKLLYFAKQFSSCCLLSLIGVSNSQMQSLAAAVFTSRANNAKVKRCLVCFCNWERTWGFENHNKSYTKALWLLQCNLKVKLFLVQYIYWHCSYRLLDSDCNPGPLTF